MSQKKLFYSYSWVTTVTHTTTTLKKNPKNYDCVVTKIPPYVSLTCHSCCF